MVVVGLSGGSSSSSRIPDFRGICHGDLTTSNFMKSDAKYYIIDFGLSQMTDTDENRAVGTGYDSFL